MTGLGAIIDWVDIVTREATLFACAGFLLGGLDDLAVDIAFWVTATARRFGWRSGDAETLADLPEHSPARLALFVPAWEESGVIGPMLDAALDRIEHESYIIYVGVYPNDRPTVDAVAAVANRDSRVRPVVGDHPGPTTKADCLNTLWRAMLQDVAAGAPAVRAVVLHDAEDLVHPDEFRIHSALSDRYDLIQIPVLPLANPRSRFIAGHYLDEFAEAHGKQLPVRGLLGAGIPLAGVGCAIRCDMLQRIADVRGGDPFDADSVTEDYELGLTVKKLGGKPVFARLSHDRGGPPIATRALFPATVSTAVRQKARWMTGIALAGWDRIGWSAPRDFADHWMRMRDRRDIVAIIVLAVAYLAIVANGLSLALHQVIDAPGLASTRLRHWLLVATFVTLCWRLAMRALFVWRSYGAAEAALSLPRSVVGNIIALMAARRAIVSYIGMLRGNPLAWDKTSHEFPEHIADPAA